MLMRFLSQANCSRWRSATHSRSTTPFLALHMTPGAKSLAIDPTGYLDWCHHNLEAVRVATQVAAGRRRRRRIAAIRPAALSAALPRPVHRIFLAGNHCSTRTYVVIISQSSDPFVDLRRAGRPNDETNVQPCQPHSTASSGAMQRRVSSETQRPSASRQSSA